MGDGGGAKRSPGIALPNLGIPQRREMARALVLQLLLAGAAAVPVRMRVTSKADDATPGHLRGLAETSDLATSHSRDVRPVDEEGAGVHDQHALTPGDLQLERGKICGDVQITDDRDVFDSDYQDCTEINGDLKVRARALARSRLIAPAAARIAPSLPCC